MKYSEATKAIQGLSKKYSVDIIEGFYSALYNGLEVLRVSKIKQYVFWGTIEPYYLDKLPYSHKLWMTISKLAMTPLNKRDEHQWNVVIGNDDRGKLPIVAWQKDYTGHGYALSLNDSDDLAYDKSIFTDSEFSNLIKYIKTLPDGEYQAKVAEHGKTLVKGE